MSFFQYIIESIRSFFERRKRLKKLRDRDPYIYEE